MKNEMVKCIKERLKPVQERVSEYVDNAMVWVHENRFSIGATALVALAALVGYLYEMHGWDKDAAGVQLFPAGSLESTTPTIEPTVVSTTYTSDQLPTVSYPGLESLYACNNDERTQTNPRIYGWDPTVTEDRILTNPDSTDWVFEVNTDNEYTISVPTGMSVHKVNFTTKSCDTDWYYVVRKRDVDPYREITVDIIE